MRVCLCVCVCVGVILNALWLCSPCFALAESSCYKGLSGGMMLKHQSKRSQSPTVTGGLTAL